jgi:hypothetical protein
MRQSYLVWVGTSFNSRNENFQWNADKIEMVENGEGPRYTSYQSTAEKTHQQDT